MTRDTEARLIEFCVNQQDRFDADEWLDCDLVTRDELAAAALFLAGVDWFGHREALNQVAETIKPGSTSRAPDVLRQARFDCLRFSTMLRRELRHALAAS